MKTAREILLARHAEAAETLDAMREKIVADLTEPAGKPRPRQPATFVEFLLSLRWHAAAMGAAWMVVLLLGWENRESGRGAVAQAGGTPPPLIYFAALREYRRELAELSKPAPSRTPPFIPHAFTPPRRREAEVDTIA